MTTPRHITIEELVADIEDHLKDLDCFDTVTHCQATRFQDVVDTIGNIAVFPAAIVLIGPAEYPAETPRAPAQRIRIMQVAILVIGTFSADFDRGADNTWDLVDRVDRAFMPTAAAPREPIQLDGVYYHPLKMDPVAVGENRSAYSLTVQAIDPVTDRSTVN